MHGRLRWGMHGAWGMHGRGGACMVWGTQGRLRKGSYGQVVAAKPNGVGIDLTRETRRENSGPSYVLGDVAMASGSLALVQGKISSKIEHVALDAEGRHLIQTQHGL